MDTIAATSATHEVFALTDEQIVGIEPEPVISSAARNPSSSEDTPPAESKRDSWSETRAMAQSSSIAALPRNDGAPSGLPDAEDTSRGTRGTEHESAETAQQSSTIEAEIAAYREVFATPEDARALKEIYPGGVNEAKAAAERARALDEIDAAFYRGDAAARLALAQRMMTEDPGAFREMVEAGMRLLGTQVASDEWRVTSKEEKSQDRHTKLSAESGQEQPEPGASAPQRNGGENRREIPRSAESTRNDGGRVGASATEEQMRAYGEFEKTANAELEKSVGGAISRAMEQALPNLRPTAAAGPAGAQHAATLQERLAGAVREEVEAALKSDRQLGEQVSRILAGRRFDDTARAQVVRLIDTRAQQLVPGAVKRVVGAWTQATLASHAKRENVASKEVERSEEKAHAQGRPVGHTAQNHSKAQPRDEMEILSPGPRARRVDYSRLTDEQILGL